jgi:hypothetical protein
LVSWGDAARNTLFLLISQTKIGDVA